MGFVCRMGGYNRLAADKLSGLGYRCGSRRQQTKTRAESERPKDTPGDRFDDGRFRAHDVEGRWVKEGVKRADVFRAGRFADAAAMARMRT